MTFTFFSPAPWEKCAKKFKEEADDNFKPEKRSRKKVVKKYKEESDDESEDDFKEKEENSDDDFKPKGEESSESSSASEAEVESEDDYKESEEDSDDDFKPEKRSKKQSLNTTTEKPKQAVEKAAPQKKTPAAGRVKPKSKPKTFVVPRGSKGVDPESLPVLVKPQDMFNDLCEGYPRFGKFAKALGRPLRVATMCSGTESPVLALGMMCKAVRQQTGVNLQMDHVFSCEIEPFKQAYIERNFQPPLLFRDIRELGNEQATTAYGGLATVPGDCDILVAGTSCVDYSNLNNEKKGLDDGGESGQTFKGMMDWVDRTQPPVVILENVCGAPWDLIAERWNQHGYLSTYTRMDSKFYYIPHTRTRVYLVAVRAPGPVKHTTEGRHKSRKFGRTEADLPEDDSILKLWVEAVRGLERPASSALEAYLLPNDDARVHAAREVMAKKEIRTRVVDWQRCESRHLRAREEEGLGNKRPLTGWEEGGTASLPDYAWQAFAKGQVHRVLDLMDINTLRHAAKGIDAQYKTVVWNLSQNCDRETGSSRPGICPCLTPSMVPYVTNRGGPVIGLEALSLQGIPVDDLLLTRESEDNMADLAGNAMTSTVVGTCIMAALVLAGEGGNIRLKKSLKHKGASNEDEEEANETAMEVDEAQMTITGENQLVSRPLSLATNGKACLKKLCEAAKLSSRQCVCEGREQIVQDILICSDCGHHACKRCAGQPEHSYIPDISAESRVLPRNFRRELKAALPMSVIFSGFNQAALEVLAGKGKTASWWSIAVSGVADAEFRFQSLKRSEVWTATYLSTIGCQEIGASRREACLEFIIDPTSDGPEWRLTVPPSITGEEAKAWEKTAALRRSLSAPVARMRPDPTGCAANILDGKWEIRLPVELTGEVSITGGGDKVATWESRLGLKASASNAGEGKQRWSQLTVASKDAELSSAVSGTYTLLPKCGTAMESLHRRDGPGPPMYLFFDPSRCGKPEMDSYVFANNHRRLAYGEGRGEVATLDAKWRTNHDTEGPQQVACTRHGKWVSVPKFVSAAGAGDNVTLAQPPAKTLLVPETTKVCHSPVAVLQCRVNLRQCNQNKQHWPAPGCRSTLDLQRSKATFDSIAWFTNKLGIPQGLSEWSPSAPTQGDICLRCAPKKASLQWHKGPGVKLQARENQLEAAEYEQGLKKRPNAFVVQLWQEKSDGVMQVGLNPASLVHRARANLPEGGNNITNSWRITEHTEEATVLNPFRFTSCKESASAPQPPHFEAFKLRPEQQRSLSWMLAQEACTEPFVEQEVAEATLPFLGWRAEAKVERPILARGGVVADQVGYGKTAITIGLIDASPNRPLGDGLTTAQLRGRHPVKATLILVPTQLMSQWPKEIKKFTNKAFKVVVIKTIVDLNKLRVEDIENADIVVSTNNLFHSDKYFPRLARLAGGHPFPSSSANGGRQFQHLYKDNLDKLRERVEQLKKSGAKEAISQVRAAATSIKDEGLLADNVGAGLGNTANRLALGKGKKATYASEKKAKKGGKKRAAEDSDDEAYSDDDEVSKPPPKKKSKGENGKGTPTGIEDDPWQLSGTGTKKGWTGMMCPPFEMFAWKRVVTDEFTYLDARDMAVVRNLTASYKWCLSGTPPSGSFQDIKGIASLLGIYLGVDEAQAIASDSKEFKALQKDMTPSEKFQARMEVRTAAWHERRHYLAQQFMDRYVRQNIAEIDEIVAEEHVEKILLTPAERAVYLELDHHLQAMEMKAKKSIKSKKTTEGDRESRLRDMLGASGSAEEALLKRCAHYDLAGNTQSAEAACHEVCKIREEQLEGCEADLAKAVEKAYDMRDTILAKDPSFDNERLKKWQHALKSEGEEGCGDVEAKDKLCALIDSIEGGPRPIKKKMLAKKTAAATEELNAEKWDLREHVHHLRRLQKELIGRVRSLRYFTAVRDMQQGTTKVTCPACGAGQGAQEWAIMSCCGHQGCYTCLIEHTERQECPMTGCKAPARTSSVVKAGTLGCDEEHAAGGKYGTKLREIVERIEAIPEDDRIIVFVQFPDLAKVVAEALTDAGVEAVEVKGSVHTKTKALDSMQEEGGPRVILLNLADESASGANLTLCNHAIFVHPMLVESQQQYTACETQAIGRIRRYGQTKKVEIWRYIVQDSIDEKIYNDRHRDWDALMKVQQ